MKVLRDHWAWHHWQTFKYIEIKSLSSVWLFATPWTIAYQAPPSLGFSRQEYGSVLPFPSPGDLPDPGIKPKRVAKESDTTKYIHTHTHKFSILFSFLLCIFKSFHFEKIKYTYKKLACSISLKDNIFIPFKETCVCAKSLQSCPTHDDSMCCSLPGVSVHEILQARKLEWVCMPSSRGSSPPRDQSRFFTTSTTWEGNKMSTKKFGEKDGHKEGLAYFKWFKIKKEVWTHIHTHTHTLTNRPPS